MGWFKKDKNKKPNKNADKQVGGGANSESSKNQPTSSSPNSIQLKVKPGSSADIRAQALANARAAREAIGEETLQKIASAIRKKQSSPTEQAKQKILEADADRVAEEILSMLETRH